MTPQAEGGTPQQASGFQVQGLLRSVWAVEWLTLANVVVTVAYLRLHHLRIDWKGFWYIVKPLLINLPLYLVVGMVATVVLRLALDRSFRPIAESLKRPSWYWEWLRLWLAMLLATYAYAWLKVNVPLVRQVLWDQELWTLDVLLHLGISPSVFLTSLFDGTFLAGWIDFWYEYWRRTVLIVLVVLTAFHLGAARRRFVTAMVLLWTFGAWIYVAIPALGPCYIFPDIWQAGTSIPYPRALGTQMGLWQNYQILQEGLATGQLQGFNPTRGIAAMPSLHVGTHVLFAIWGWYHLRPIFVVFLLAAIFTFLGSILTGWHYAIDGYVGAGLAWLSYVLARRLEPEPEPDREPSAS